MASVVKKEPVVTAAVVASAIVTILNLFGVVVDISVVQNVVSVLLFLVASFVARSKVTPVDV